MNPANNHFCKLKSKFILLIHKISVVPAIEPRTRIESNINNEPNSVKRKR